MELLILSSQARGALARPASPRLNQGTAGSTAGAGHTIFTAPSSRGGDGGAGVTERAGAGPWEAGWGGGPGVRQELRARSPGRPGSGAQGRAACPPPPARLISMVHSLRAGAQGGEGAGRRGGGSPARAPSGPGTEVGGRPQPIQPTLRAWEAAWPAGGKENNGNASMNRLGDADAPRAAAVADGGARESAWPPPLGAARPVVDTPLGAHRCTQ